MESLIDRVSKTVAGAEFERISGRRSFLARIAKTGGAIAVASGLVAARSKSASATTIFTVKGDNVACRQHPFLTSPVLNYLACGNQYFVNSEWDGDCASGCTYGSCVWAKVYSAGAGGYCFVNEGWVNNWGGSCCG